MSLTASRACFLVPTNRTVPPRRAMSAANSRAFVEQRLGLQQVDDVDAVPLSEDEAAHLGVPAARLVAEMYAGLQQLFDSDLSHRYCSLVNCLVRPTGAGGRNLGLESRAGLRPAPAGLGKEFEHSLRKFLLRATVSGRSGRPLPYHRWMTRNASRTPFPYLRWIGSQQCGGAALDGPPRRHFCFRSVAAPFGALQRRGQIRRQRRAHVDRRRVTGCSKASRAACRNWRSSPYSPGRPVLGIAAHRVPDRGQVHADLMGAAGLQR